MDMGTSAIVLKQQMADPGKAGSLMKLLLAPKGTEGRQEVMDLVKAEPQLALAALQHGDQALGLTPRGSADVLEEVIGAVGEDAAAAHLVEQNLTPERVAELLAARGDLPSAAAEVATLQQLIDAIREDVRPHGTVLNPDPGLVESSTPFVGRPPRAASPEDVDTSTAPEDVLEEGDEDSFEDEEDDNGNVSAEAHSDFAEDEKEEPSGDVRLLNDPYLTAQALLAFRSWALKLKGRKDYAELLMQRIFGSRIFRTYVLLAVYLEAHQPQDLSEVTIDLYDSVGIDPEEGASELARILSRGELDEVELDPEAWHEAGVAYSESREAKARAPKTIDELERDKAKSAAAKLGF